MTDELLPCPFCGRKAEMTECVGGWMIDCYYANPITAVEDNELLCGMNCFTDLFPTAEGAIKIWNTRSIK
ncbi:MAG: Lar family restriction alleviation protein [Microgenomates group bacterium]